ncbi:MAG TPA: class I SAM-dependent methyltransferase [Parvibaculum sp.]|jgi:SAM-dependent methyltransferase
MTSSVGLDPRQVEHNRVWAAKKTLRLIYGDYHRRLMSVCPVGPLLDIGAGIGHAKQHRPDMLSVDILQFPGIDVVCDAQRLPFLPGHFSGIAMLDVLHHLERPLDFLHEASRILRPGGVLAMIEPGMSPVAYPFYRFLHEEPADTGCDPFVPVISEGTRDPFDANQAIPTVLFREENRKRLQELLPDLAVRQTEWLSVAAFPLSGGFKSWCLLPASLTERTIQAENLLPGWVRRLFGFRIMVVLQKVA